MGPSTDVSLFFSLATAIATALTAAVKLGLLDVGHPDGDWTARQKRALRGVATFTLCAAVIGILAALIAVGKGRSERLLTILIFVGLVAPATYTLWATLHDKLKLRRRPLAAAMMGVGACAGLLIVATSPELIRSVIAPHDIDAERRHAEEISTTPANSAGSYECDSARRCVIPGVKTPVFNAFTNTASAGDERDFAQASLTPRSILSTSSAGSVLRFNVVEVRPFDEVRLFVYYRNAGCRPVTLDTGAASCDSTVVTRNARVGVFVPSTASAGQSVLVVLYADNAQPPRIADRVAFVSDTPFRLELISESARMINGYSGGTDRQGGRAPGFGIPLDDRIVQDLGAIDGRPTQFTRQMGVRLGYQKLNGELEAGFGNAGYVTVRMRIVPDD